MLHWNQHRPLRNAPLLSERTHRFKQSTKPASSRLSSSCKETGSWGKKTVIWILLRANYVFVFFLKKMWIFSQTLPIEPSLIHCEGLWRIDRCSKIAHVTTCTRSQKIVAMVSEATTDTTQPPALTHRRFFCRCRCITLFFFCFSQIPRQITK